MKATIRGAAFAAWVVLVGACGSGPPSGDASTSKPQAETEVSATTAPTGPSTSGQDEGADTDTDAGPDTDVGAAPDVDEDRWAGGVPGGVEVELLDPARFSVDEWFVVDDDGRRAAGWRGTDELCEVDLAAEGSAPPRCAEIPSEIVDALQMRRFLALRWPSDAPLALTFSGGQTGATGAEAFTFPTYVVDFVAGTVIGVATGEQEIVLGVDTDRTVTLHDFGGTPSEPGVVREVGLDGVERRVFGAVVLAAPPVRQGGDASLFVVGDTEGGSTEAGRSVARIGDDGISAVAATEASTAIHDASDSGNWALVVDRHRLNLLEPAPLTVVDPVAGTTVALPLPAGDSVGFPVGWFADDDRLVVGWWSELPSGRWSLGVVEIDADGRAVGDWHELAAWSVAERDQRPDACSPPGAAGFVGSSGDVAVMELTQGGATTLCRVRLRP